jgi:hypothetical protein
MAVAPTFRRLLLLSPRAGFGWLLLALTSADRDEKADRLLRYVGSRQCADLLDKTVKLTRDMSDLDAKEASGHETVWRRRGDLIRRIQAANAELLTEINRIIGGNVPDGGREAQI